MQPLLIAVLLLQPCPQALIPGHEGIRCPVSPVATETQTQEPTVSPVASDDDSYEDTRIPRIPNHPLLNCHLAETL